MLLFFLANLNKDQIPLKLSSTITTSADSMARSLAELPKLTPRSLTSKLGASLIPSPKNKVLFGSCLIISALSSGSNEWS